MELRDALDLERAITHGWEGFKLSPWVMGVGSLLILMTSSNSGNINVGDLEGLTDDGEGGMIIAAVLLAMAGVACFCMVMGFLINAWIMPGFIRVHRELVADGETSFSTLFSGFDVLFRMILWKFLVGFITFGIIAVSVLPGGFFLVAGSGLVAGSMGDAQLPALFAGGGALTIGFVLLFVGIVIAIVVATYVSLGLSFGSQAIALDGLGPIEALERSWTLVDGHRWPLLLFTMVLGLVSLLGMMACCVGIIVTSGIAGLGWTEAYLIATCEDWEEFYMLRPQAE